MTRLVKNIPAVFVDRDGTICEDSHYLSESENLRVYEFAAAAIRKLTENGFIVIVVSNQSGIGRGFISELQLREINRRLIVELEKGGALLQAIYYCPHLPEDNCDCRKPKIGMLKQAEADFGICLTKCWLIGDKSSDIETARNAGMKGILVRTGYGKSEELKADADFVAETLTEAADLIVRHSHKK